MKFTKKIKIILVLTVSHIPFISAQDKKTDHHKFNPTIHTYIEEIQISSIEFVDIMSVSHNSTDFSVLRNKLITLVKTGQAKFISNQSLNCISKDIKTVMKSGQRFLAPYDYESPYPYPGQLGKAALKTEVLLPPIPNYFNPFFNGIVSDYKHTLLKDGNKVFIKYRTSISEFFSYNLMQTWNTELVKSKVQKKNFYTNHLETELTLTLGEFTLACTYTPLTKGKPDESKKNLVFIKCNISQPTKSK